MVTTSIMITKRIKAMAVRKWERDVEKDRDGEEEIIKSANNGES